jgi:hypothetical protein
MTQDLWAFVPEPSFDKFKQDVTQCAGLDFLKHVLSDLPVLSQLRHLPRVLMLLRDVRQRLEFRVSAKECRSQTIRELRDKLSRTDRRDFDRNLERMQQCWAVAWPRVFVFGCSRYNDPTQPEAYQYHGAQITADSPLAFLIPAKDDEGQCLRALLARLRDAQNNAVQMLARYTSRSESTPLPTVPSRFIESAHTCAITEESLRDIVHRCDFLPLSLICVVFPNESMTQPHIAQAAAWSWH